MEPWLKDGQHWGCLFVRLSSLSTTTAGALTLARSSTDGLITGTALAGSTIASVTTYNAFGEPAMAATANGTDTLWRAVYTRDELGRITGVTETILGTTTAKVYAYSDTGFLVRVTENGTVTARYGYDANGNRVRLDAPGDSATATYDDQDRLLRYRGTRYSYTAAGELLTKITAADTTRYTYDAFGNLIKVRFQDADTLTYVADGRNRRIARKFEGVVTRWLYQDGLKPVAEVDSTGSVITRFVYGTRPHVPDYMVRADTMYRIVADHLGSVRLVVNATSGAVVQRIDYDGFGRVTQDTRPGFQPFGYAGGLWDAVSGLVRFGARDYDPLVGRWTTKDPIGFAGGSANLMAYVDADPLNTIDPTGTDAQDDLNSIAGFWDCLSLGAASRIRAKYFGYNDIDSHSRTYASGVASGRDVLLALATGPTQRVISNAVRGLGLDILLGESRIGSSVPKGMVQAFERQLAQNGPASLRRSLQSIEQNLLEHQIKLETIRAAGGYTSSLEREIMTFERQIKAIRYLLGAP